MNPQDIEERLTQLENQSARLRVLEAQSVDTRRFHFWQSVLSILIVVLLIGLTANAVFGQELATPTVALDWALADQLTLPELDREWQRYLWIPPWGFTDSWGAVASFALNTAASHAAIIVRPRVIANGWMLAVDLRRLAPRSLEQLTRLREVWDGLAPVEPYFHIFQESEQGVFAVYAPHIKRDHAELLAELNVSPALVYRLDWFLTRLLDTEYYDFMQFGNTFDEVMTSIGVNPALSKALSGDQRAAIFFSLVSGKPRRVERIQGVGGRSNTGAVWTTGDIFDETVELARHIIYNLRGDNVDGGETIFERANGMHGFILHNAENVLVRVAPPNLVSDHTIPAPYTRQLRPAISCLRCHKEKEGLQDVGNDVLTLVNSGVIDIVDDLSGLDVSREQLIQDIAGLYTGDFGRRIALGREDYRTAVRLATQQPNRKDGFGVEEICSLASSIYGSYMYTRVDAAMACREFGYEPGENPIDKLQQILPSLVPDTQIDLRAEDPTIGGLKAGLQPVRTDFARVYAAAMLLVSQGEKIQ